MIWHRKSHYENLEKLSNFLLIFWRNLFSDLKFVQKRHLPKMVYTSTVHKKIHTNIVKKKKRTCNIEVSEWSTRSTIFQSLWISSYTLEASLSQIVWLFFVKFVSPIHQPQNRDIYTKSYLDHIYKKVSTAIQQAQTVSTPTSLVRKCKHDLQRQSDHLLAAWNLFLKPLHKSESP